MRKLSFGWTVACVLGLLACEQRGERRAANGTATTPNASTSVTASVATTVATPPPAPTAAPAPSASASTATAAASASASASAAAAKTCEVEIFGSVAVPKDAPKSSKVVVYVAQDDCLAADAQVLGHIPASPNGGFVIEVFPKWGTDVTICASVEDATGNATHYAKATSKAPNGKFHAEAEGEVTFNDVKLAPKKGPPHRFPHEAK